MSSFNKVFLLGNVGADPEIKTFQNGNPVANFSLATTKNWKDKTTGEKKSQTDWHKIVCYSSGLCVTIQQYIKKGSKILIEGELKYREYEKDGIKHKVTEIVMNNFSSELVMLDKRNEEGQPSYGYDTSQSSSDGLKKATFDFDDEIPF